MTPKPSVYIAYGFAEGPRVAKKAAHALQSADFQLTDDCSGADTIIAHSMGCFELPNQLRAQTVLLVGPSTGFVGSPIQTQVQKVRHDFKHARKSKQIHNWISKSLWNSTYLTTLLHRLPEILRGARALRHTLPRVGAKNVVVFLYRNDPWSWHMPKSITTEHPTYSFVSHPGAHDDIWIHPQEYVSVLQYLYETRLLAAANGRKTAISRTGVEQARK
jgi:hypothetical protein